MVCWGRTLLLAAVVLGAVAVSAQARPSAQRPLVIEAGGVNVPDINGTWHRGESVVARLAGWSMSSPSLAGAIRVFGAPARCVVPYTPSGVIATWPRVGMVVRFYTLGGDPPGLTGCTAPDVVVISDATLTGPRWQTPRGLRVGMRVSDILRLALTPERHGSSWWIYKAWNDIGEPGWRSSLTAHIARGRIVSFTAEVGAGGD